MEKSHENSIKIFGFYFKAHCLFNLFAEYFMQNAELDEAQAEIKIAGRNIITSDMQMIPPLWQIVKN